MFGKVFKGSPISKLITFLGLVFLVSGFLNFVSTNNQIDVEAMPVTPSCGDFDIPIGTTFGTSYDSSVSGNNLYVVNTNTDSLYVIDVTTNTLTNTINIANQPRAVVNLNGKAYVFTVGTNTMVQIDEATNTILNTYPLSANFSIDDIVTYQDKIYISLFNSLQVFNTLTDTFETGSRPASNYPRILGTINNKIYYSHSGNNNIQIVDYNTNAVTGTNINVGTLVSKGALIGTDLFAITLSSNSFRQIDTTTDTVSDSFFLAGSVTDIDAVGTTLYLKGINNTTLYEIDTTNSNSINTVTTSGQGNTLIYVENKLIVDNFFAGTKSDLIFLDDTTLEPRFTLSLPPSSGHYTDTYQYIDDKLYIGTDRNVTIVDLVNEELLQPCPPTTIAPANYDSADCVPATAEIGTDTLTCTIDLTGNSDNNYALPGTGITANIDGLASGSACTIQNNMTASAELVCANIPTTGGTPGVVDVETNDTTVTQVIDNVTLQNPGATEILPANYGSSNCTPDPASIGQDLVTCLIDLTGSSVNNYSLPASGITAYVDGSTSSPACDIINNGTVSAQLRCQNLPTTGASEGSTNVFTNDTATITLIDTITLELTPTEISASNYGASNCQPDPAIIGFDTVSCSITLTGSPSGEYELPPAGITANILGLGSGDACTIQQVDETPTYELVCTNIPTAGGTPGNNDVETNSSSVTTTFDSVELVDPVDSDNDGVLDPQENNDGTNPSDPNDYQDSDGDTVPDQVENSEGTNPFDPGDFLDDDNGGLPNYVETILIPNNGGAPLNTTNGSDDSDPDGDGVGSSEELLAFNSGDGNNDGVLDMIQSDVTSKYNPLSDSYITMESTVCNNNENLDFISESDNAISDEGYDYPYGLHRFTINCTTPGSTATVKFYWGKSLDTSNWIYRKYNENSYFGFQDIAISQELVNGELITVSSISVTDGGEYDLDGQVNGQIIDPAGPALLEITGNQSIDNLIRTGGKITKNIDNLKVASGLLFLAASLLLIISHSISDKKTSAERALYSAK